MNNEQFRKLLASNSSASKNGTSATPKPGGATPALGSRLKSSIPMTPRSVAGSRGGVDFRKQLLEHNAASEKTRKFRTAAPKGSRLAEGYVDRTRQRVDTEEDEKAKRIKALEEQMKLGQIDEATFLRTRDAITGGDISNTHLVKGLDFKLLERVKRGEDVLSVKAKEGEEEEKEGEPAKDLDDEFEELNKNLEVVPEVKEKVEKKGKMAQPGLVAGQKRTRDQILAELKAQRKAAAQAKAEAMALKLGKNFKKIGGPAEPRIEVDAKGREILITVDEEGNIKRRVRKAPKQEEEIVPDKNAEVLGANIIVPELPPPPPDSDDDVDIFEEAGHDFNPFENVGSDSEDEEADSKPKPILKPSTESDEGEVPSRSQSRSASPSAPKPSIAPRNYFDDDPSTLSVLGNLKNNLSDPTVLAALANSRKLDPSKLSASTRNETEEEEARRKRHAAMISRDDRDMDDMDMGFGSSRFDDAEEMATEGEKFKLSKWKGLKAGDDEDDEDEEGVGGAKKKRKRGGGKRKGDKNDAGDVLKAMERKKKE
jgi:RED-like protein N-terminal region